MRVALAYSGGLDTSVSSAWMVREEGHEVIAVFVDIGQEYSLEQVEARAAAAGVTLEVVDAREDFVERHCLPALWANALYEGKYPLVSALARPLIAEKVVEVARRHGCDAVAHGCTGKGNDQVRFETSFAALAPDLVVMAPIRERTMSRDEAIALARRWDIPLSAEQKVYSIDENLWGRTAECGPLEDPWDEPPADAFGITVDPRSAPVEGVEVVVGFESGRPVSLDGVAVSAGEAITRLSAIGGAHGFGRVDMIENRLVGIKSRELYEVPGALALIRAHQDLEDLVLERDLAHEKASMERRWAELCYYGLWFGPLHESLRTFMASTQARVTGEVRLRFHKGSCTVVGRRSPLALYDKGLATYDGAADTFDHRHAAGFVRLWSLPTRTWAAHDPAVSGRTTPPIPAGAGVSPPPGPSTADVEGSGSSAFDTPDRVLPPQSDVAGNGHGKALWSGRFASAPAEDAMAFTRSISFDMRLAPYDIACTKAHARGLAKAGLLEVGELDQVLAALDAIAADITAGSFQAKPSDEDVHSAVESALTERLGDLGARIHAGRSRNDLVAADLRLWTRDAARALASGARALASALADRARDQLGAVMPGYTHVQRGQPVLLSQHLLAHAFPLARDAERLDRAAATANRSPLGAGALAGTTLPIDPHAIADELGFDGVLENSIDAVSDRDFAVEFLAAATSTAVHLSRLAEDLVLWCSREFGFATPDDAYATGSSMMPQKKNPDVAELARGKAGRVLGDLVRLATVLKGLPLAYDRDLQEDKEAVFDAHDGLQPALDAMAGMVRTLTFHTDRMREACDDGFVLATDVAEALVAKGVPFRTAHHAVGELVKELESKERTFADMTAGEWREWQPSLDPDAVAQLTPEAAVERRTHGTSSASVERQLRVLAEALGR